VLDAIAVNAPRIVGPLAVARAENRIIHLTENARDIPVEQARITATGANDYRSNPRCSFCNHRKLDVEPCSGGTKLTYCVSFKLFLTRSALTIGINIADLNTRLTTYYPGRNTLAYNAPEQAGMLCLLQFLYRSKNKHLHIIYYVFSFMY
jgi:hypothetical protein